MVFLLSALSIYGNTYYVHGDVGNVRKSPKSGSTVVAKLRINTEFTSSKSTNDGWIYVNNIRTPYGTVSIDGWIYKSVLGSEKVSEQELLQKINRSSSAKEKIKWAERLVALKPEKRDSWKKLKIIAQKSNNKKALERASRVLNGIENTYVALCDGHARLVGYIDSIGKYHDLTWNIKVDPNNHSKKLPLGKRDKGQLKRIKGMLYDVSTVAWYDGDKKIDGSPFAKAKIGQSKKTIREGLYKGQLIMGKFPRGNNGKYIFSQPMKKISSTKYKAVHAKVKRNIDLEHCYATKKRAIGLKGYLKKCSKEGKLINSEVKTWESPMGGEGGKKYIYTLKFSSFTSALNTMRRQRLFEFDDNKIGKDPQSSGRYISFDLKGKRVENLFVNGRKIGLKKLDKQHGMYVYKGSFSPVKYYTYDGSRTSYSDNIKIMIDYNGSRVDKLVFNSTLNGYLSDDEILTSKLMAVLSSKI